MQGIEKAPHEGFLRGVLEDKQYLERANRDSDQMQVHFSQARPMNTRNDHETTKERSGERVEASRQRDLCKAERADDLLSVFSGRVLRRREGGAVDKYESDVTGLV